MSERQPQRIQLRRTKGWRKPEGAVVVARPSKWGNPFTIAEVGWAYPSLDLTQCAGMAVSQLRDLIRAGLPITLNVRQAGGDRKLVTYDYPPVAEIRRELAGRDLACWCPLDQPCHADVLLEIANPPTKEARP